MKKHICLLSIVLCLASLCFAEQLQPGFYDSANGLQDGELKDTLKSLIRDHTAIPYGSGANSTWGVFYYSDSDDDDYCMDMYCDDWYKFTSPGNAVTGCNIEHSFAKSWWGGANNDAYKDCYHLNPSNSNANSARSNYPLGVPEKDIKTAGSLLIGKIHHDSLNVDFFVFEPKDEYKGDFARAYFYMATCYGHWSNGQIDPVLSQYNGWRTNNSDVGSKFAMQNDNYLEFQPWEQEVLIQWHRQDPVSEKEIRRMDAVSDFQHNRNPFIDYPYLAEYIWGDMAGTPVDMTMLVASSDPEFIPGHSNGWRGGSVTPVQQTKYGVTWMVNGEAVQIDSIVENKKVQAFPATPVSCSLTSTEFMGWTDAPIADMTDEQPAVLYTVAKDIPMVKNDLTLYAVFARKNVYDGGESATYLFDDDHQEGWTTDANYTSYWLLDGGTTLVSPELNLAGLSSITVVIRTYGGTENNTLSVKAGDLQIATIVTTTGTTMTSYTWTNTGSFVGYSPLTFFCPMGASRKGIGLQSARIEATGTHITYSDYLTGCGTEDIEIVNSQSSNRKFIKDGQLFILVGDHTYTVTGQRVK